MTYPAKIATAGAVALAPRAYGALHLSAKRRDDNSVIDSLRQEGSLKALFPRARDTGLDAVFLNTAGGLTGGDRMHVTASAGPGTHVTLSSQAAERAYRAQPGQIAHSTAKLDVAAGARLNWLPQETILFDHAALTRRMTVRLHANATALLVEPVIFGRAAMGEVVQHVQFTDHWRISRAGRLIFADSLRLIGNADDLLQRLAIASGAAAIATIVFVGSQAASLAAAIDLPDSSGASLIADDLLAIRLLAKDGFALRQQMIPVITKLAGTPLPRVWSL